LFAGCQHLGGLPDRPYSGRHRRAGIENFPHFATIPSQTKIRLHSLDLIWKSHLLLHPVHRHRPGHHPERSCPQLAPSGIR
jgi:hypothetical protein